MRSPSFLLPRRAAASARFRKVMEGTDIVTSSLTISLIAAAAWPTPILKISTRASFSSSDRLTMLGVQRVDQLVYACFRDGFFHEADTDFAGAVTDGVLHIGGDEEDMRVRIQRAQLLGRRHAADAGHVDVEQNQERRERLGLFQCLFHGCCFSDLPVGMFAENELVCHQT